MQYFCQLMLSKVAILAWTIPVNEDDQLALWLAENVKQLTNQQWRYLNIVHLFTNTYAVTWLFEMNEQQALALGLALSGHNLCLLGLPGTGKTFTTKKIVEKLKDQGKIVSITASTGAASCLHADAGTLHR